MTLGRLAHGHHINTFPNQLFLYLLFSGFLSPGSVSCTSGLQHYDPYKSYPHQLQTTFYTLLISTTHTLQLNAQKYTVTLIDVALLFLFSTFSDPTTMMSYLLSNKGAHIYFGNIKYFVTGLLLPSSYSHHIHNLDQLFILVPISNHHNNIIILFCRIFNFDSPCFISIHYLVAFDNFSCGEKFNVILQWLRKKVIMKL